MTQRGPRTTSGHASPQFLSEQICPWKLDPGRFTPGHGSPDVYDVTGKKGVAMACSILKPGKGQICLDTPFYHSQMTNELVHHRTSHHPLQTVHTTLTASNTLHQHLAAALQGHQHARSKASLGWTGWNGPFSWELMAKQSCGLADACLLPLLPLSCRCLFVAPVALRPWHWLSWR